MTAIGPGSRVKCICADWTPGSTCTPLPTVGSIWTVAHIYRAGSLLLGFPLAKDFLAFVGREKHLFVADYFVPLDGDAEMEKLRKIAKDPAPRVSGGVYA